MKGNELELWIASLTTCNFFIVQSKRLMLIINSQTLPIRVCAAQRGRDFEAPDLEWGIHFRDVF